jgi:hypothetical protein
VGVAENSNEFPAASTGPATEKRLAAGQATHTPHRKATRRRGTSKAGSLPPPPLSPLLGPYSRGTAREGGRERFFARLSPVFRGGPGGEGPRRGPKAVKAGRRSRPLPRSAAEGLGIALTASPPGPEVIRARRAKRRERAGCGDPDGRRPSRTLPGKTTL